MQDRNPAGGFIAFTGGLVAAIVLAVLFIVVADSTPQASPYPTQPPAAATTAPTAASAPAASGPGTINATESDFAIALDKTTVPAGTVTFNITNKGPSPHNLGVVDGSGASKAGGITGKSIKDSENIDGGKTGTLTVDLKPGTYQVICSIPGHIQLGMIVQITVT